jgi:hypothetical protein
METVVETPIGDVTSGLRGLLVAEIVIPPLFITEKSHITCDFVNST